MTIDELLQSESLRREQFPVTAHRTFLAHAGVAPLPKVAVDAMNEFCARGSVHAQENAWSNGQMLSARDVGARLLGCASDEISLLGPTALGLSIVANGIPWRPGDEIVYYPDDYPANVYPWTSLAAQGVIPVPLRPEYPGVITMDTIEAALSSRTRLVTLATCNFLCGFRMDIDNVGYRLRERGILFCLDAIQTLGAFPISVQHVDFLSADSHKWMLGPAAAGILYVKRELQDMLRPCLLGSWNVCSPQFVAQQDIRFESGGRRYEPGMLNLPGIIGMAASLKLLLDIGIDTIGTRILELREALLRRLEPLGFHQYLEAFDRSDAADGTNRSGIVSVTHETQDLKRLARELEANGVTVSCRENRAGQVFLRFSPHFYNTESELDHMVEVLFRAMS
ncbi:MAG: aminotransferase class V-fold PLP-dependent enzyme [Candidatus Hydrogenedentes bacterium]|nr:aminotransferase class V-fold PLP-dependent enzyme [Candidatus Hydrogenedentota bacterium]